MRPVLLLLALLLAATILFAQSDPPNRVGRLNYANGPVSFQPAGESDWLDAPINRPLVPGDSLWSGNGARAELHIGSTALRLAPNTAFQLLNLDDQTVQIRLSEGSLTLHIRQLQPRELFEIDTPNLAFTLTAPGEYRIDASPDAQTTTVTIRDGNGEISGGGQSFTLNTRQQAVITGDQQIDYRVNSAPITDAWDQWCTARDRREDQSQSARYVSREVPGYEDLDQYGAWSNQSGYGDVWMPNGVSAGWAPYRDGHWAWITPWGWTWIDDAPWGFAPYHYGRWASFGNRWGWIPGPRGMSPTYAPALVAWIGGAGFSASVGWFALGPREPYFPSYQVSQNYFRRVNSSNTVFNTATINGYYQNRAINSIQYRNRNTANGITAVPQDNFATGRRTSQNGRTVLPSQPGNTQIFNNPNVTPRRESVLGIRGQGGAAPPARAFNRPVVARTPPPQAPVPFSRQQEQLNRTPGRPLPPAAIQQMHQADPTPAPQVRVIERNPNRGGQSGAAPAQQPNRLPQQAQQPRENPRQQQQDRAPQPQAQPPQAQQPTPQQRQQQPRENPRQPHQQDRAPHPQAQPPQAQQPAPQQRQQQPRENPRQQQQQDRAPQPQAQPPQAQQPAPQQRQQQPRENPRQQQQQDRAPQPQAQPQQQDQPAQENARPPKEDRTERKKKQ